MSKNKNKNHWAIGLLAIAAFAGPSGCSQPAKRPEAHASAPVPESRSGSKVSGRGAADVQFALGRSLEAAGKSVEAESAYRVALKNDPGRGDAHARLAVLLGGRGAFGSGAICGDPIVVPGIVDHHEIPRIGPGLHGLSQRSPFIEGC